MSYTPPSEEIREETESLLEAMEAFEDKARNRLISTDYNPAYKRKLVEVQKDLAELRLKLVTL